MVNIKPLHWYVLTTMVTASCVICYMFSDIIRDEKIAHLTNSLQQNTELLQTCQQQLIVAQNTVAQRNTTISLFGVAIIVQLLCIVIPVNVLRMI